MFLTNIGLQNIPLVNLLSSNTQFSSTAQLVYNINQSVFAISYLVLLIVVMRMDARSAFSLLLYSSLTTYRKLTGSWDVIVAIPICCIFVDTATVLTLTSTMFPGDSIAAGRVNVFPLVIVQNTRVRDK